MNDIFLDFHPLATSVKHFMETFSEETTENRSQIELSTHEKISNIDSVSVNVCNEK